METPFQYTNLLIAIIISLFTGLILHLYSMSIQLFHKNVYRWSKPKYVEILEYTSIGLFILGLILTSIFAFIEV